MGIYQALQLNAAGSKALIANAGAPAEKRKWSLVYFLKNILCVGFCMAVVMAFTMLFGQENSTPGVVVLLSVLVFRFSDFGMRAKQSVGVIYLVFAILTFGPHLANLAGVVPGFFINLACIFIILRLSCHNVILMNHATFVLGYLLMFGYDASGVTFLKRILEMAVGATITAVIFYAKHRKIPYKRSVGDVWKEFRPLSTRGQWQIKHALGISLSMLLAGLLGVPRMMWVGIAAMSVLLPMPADQLYREKRRLLFNMIGSLAFCVIYLLLPAGLRPYIGALGGLGVGFSATYAWQTFFNTFGALQIAVGIFGLPGAILLRIISNAFGSLFSLLFDKLYAFGVARTYRRRAEVSASMD